MKSFSVFLNEINDGSTHAAITADFAELLRTVQATGRAGALSIKLKVSPTSRGQAGFVDKVTVVADRKLELPKPEQPADFFWLTDDCETTRNHPRQQELALREVAKPANEFSQPDADGVVTFKEAK